MASDPVTTYAKRVMAGKVPAGEWHRLACERHLKDLEQAEAKGLLWRPQLGRDAFKFFSYLHHYKGEWAGRPLILAPWQKFVVGSLMGWLRASDRLRRFRTAFVEVPRGQGKSTMAAGLGLYLTFFDHEPAADGFCVAPLGLATEVPTPAGWRTIGTLAVGDWVFDETGNPCQITGVSPVFVDRPCYELEFSDGTTVTTDADHRWRTVSVGRNGARRAPTVRTTAEIHQTLKTGWIRGGISAHYVPVAGPLKLPPAALPIGPYTLGIWLGDGRQNRGAIVLTRSDSKAVVAGIASEGYAVSYQSDPTLARFTILGLRTQLRHLGLLERKDIPFIYFRGSIEQRLALLRGLMDTDGTCTKTGECRFTNRNRALAEGVRDLAMGLGLRAHLRAVIVKDAPHYVVSFKAPASLHLFALKRKQSRLRRAVGIKATRRYIVDIRSVASVPVCCLEVDSPSSLFLVTRALIATHNTKRDQARIVHETARQMVLASSALRQHIKVQLYNLHSLSTASRFQPLGADADTTDGLRPQVCVADEVHAHPSSDLIDVLQTGMGSRRQPLMFEITTAGVGHENVWWSHREYSSKVLQGILDDETWFAFIACADVEDDWTTPATWKKANPNYGISVKPDYLAAECEKAKAMLGYQNAFRRLHCGQLVEQLDRYLDMEVWDSPPNSQPLDLATLKGRPCWAGLDLSSKVDMTALVLVFRNEDQGFTVLPEFWIPADNIAKRVTRDRVPYDVWAQQPGLHLNLTSGNVVDQQGIRQRIRELGKLYSIQEIAFDPWNATQMAVDLEADGFHIAEMRQGFRTMTEPTKALQAAVVGGKLHHGGHPILRWNASNLVVREDPNQNVAPDKAKATERIDGMVALIMGLGRAIVQVPPVPKQYQAFAFGVR